MALPHSVVKRAERLFQLEIMRVEISEHAYRNDPSQYQNRLYHLRSPSVGQDRSSDRPRQRLQGEAVGRHPVDHTLDELKVANLLVRQFEHGSFYIRRMLELLAQVLGQLWMPLRTESLEALFAEERAQDRASLTAQLPVVLGNVLGQGAKVEAKEWMTLETESMALRRSVPWWPTAFASSTGAEDGADGTRRDRPALGVDAGRHRDMKVLSVLYLPLWDAARWRGLAYTFARGPADVPEIHFLFEDIEAGRKIFRGWLGRFGEVDRDDTIGLTLVTGVDRDHPDWYRLAVGYRDADVLMSDAPVLGFSLRMQEMNPRDGYNLGQFLERYRRLGRYRIAPMENQAAGGVVRTTRQGIGIEKRRLKIVPAWKIGPDDFLRTVLWGVANPVVPSGEEDPPFHRPSTGGPVRFDDGG